MGLRPDPVGTGSGQLMALHACHILWDLAGRPAPTNPAKGDGPCALCGGTGPLHATIGSNFTDYRKLARIDGTRMCAACSWTFGGKPPYTLRMWSIVARETGAVNKRIRGRLPITVINTERTAREDRIAATIRHNRARGVHQVDAMSEIVRDLALRNHSDAWIAKELGMEPDEVLRLKQITAMAELFADREFSEAWEADLGDPTDDLG